MEKNNKKAILLGLSAVLFWSTVATAFKIALKYVSPSLLLLVSSISSAFVLFVIIIISRRATKLFKPSLRQLLSYAIFGFLNPFLYYLVLFEAYDRLPAQEAQPLNYTWAIVVSVLAALILKQKLTWQVIGGLLLSFAGVIVIITKGSFSEMMPGDPLGTALALGSSLIWGFYWVLTANDESDEIIRLFYNFAFGSVFILLYVLIFKGISFPGIEGLVASAYVGVFEMGITFVLWLFAMKSAENVSRVAGLIYFSPFISLVLIHYVLGEHIHGSSIAGLALIVGGTVLQRYSKKSKASIRT